MSLSSSCTVVDLTAAAAPARAKRFLDAVVDLSVPVSCPAAKRCRVGEVVDLSSSDVEGEEVVDLSSESEEPEEESEEESVEEPTDAVVQYLLQHATLFKFKHNILRQRERKSCLDRHEDPQPPCKRVRKIAGVLDLVSSDEEGEQTETEDDDDDVPFRGLARRAARKTPTSKRQPEVIGIDDDEDMVVTEASCGMHKDRVHQK